MKDLSIIIVNYNTPNLVYDCIESINKYLNVSYETIVIDNGSKNKVDPDHISKFLHTTYLPLASNRGFGAGNNAGVKIAKGKYLLLLNSDTLLVDDSIDKMLKFYKDHKEIGALTCLLYQRKNGPIQRRFFGKFQSLFGLMFRYYNYQKINLNQEFFYTDIVTGAALMIKRDLYNKLNGFDKNFFMYLEDDDLCKRLVDMGYKNAVLNTAKIVHLEGKSSNSLTRRRYYYKSQNLYWKKHNGIFATMLMRTIRFPYSIVQFIVSLSS